jgi:hypothetical protein
MYMQWIPNNWETSGLKYFDPFKLLPQLTGDPINRNPVYMLFELMTIDNQVNET